MPEDTLVPPGFEPYDLPDFMALVGPLYRRIEGRRFKVGFRVGQHHCNPAGICHGGMIMTVMDVALGEQLILAVADKVGFTPTISLSTEFLSPGRLGDWIESEDLLIQINDGVGFSQGCLNGPRGPVAQGRAFFRLSPR